MISCEQGFGICLLDDPARHKTAYIKDYEQLLVAVRRIEGEPNNAYPVVNTKSNIKRGYSRVFRIVIEESDVEMLKRMTIKINVTGMLLHL